MWIGIIALITTGAILYVSLCRMAAPATVAERLADDEAQINYLREWRERHGRS